VPAFDEPLKVGVGEVHAGDHRIAGRRHAIAIGPEPVII